MKLILKVVRPLVWVCRVLQEEASCWKVNAECHRGDCLWRRFSLSLDSVGGVRRANKWGGWVQRAEWESCGPTDDCSCINNPSYAVTKHLTDQIHDWKVYLVSQFPIPVLLRWNIRDHILPAMMPYYLSQERAQISLPLCCFYQEFDLSQRRVWYVPLKRTGLWVLGREVQGCTDGAPVDEHSGNDGFSDAVTKENLTKASEGQGDLFWLTG